MKPEGRTLEVKVGAFVFAGLAVLAVLVVQFGRLNEGFKRYYPITVRFADASGLLKGSDVLFAGAKIGKVAGPPTLAPSGGGVAVPLRIYEHIRIPAGSKFSVGSSGLLGDRFVNVAMPKEKPEKVLAPGAIVQGTRETGLDDLTREGNLLLEDLRGAVSNINSAAVKLDQQALSQQNMDNLKSSIAHLDEAMGALAASSKKVEAVLEKGDATMTSARQTADELQLAIGDARKTIQGASRLMQEATTGDGLLPALLHDEKLAGDLRALVSNLRRRGVLFYRDVATQEEARATASPASTRERRPR